MIYGAFFEASVTVHLHGDRIFKDIITSVSADCPVREYGLSVNKHRDASAVFPAQGVVFHCGGRFIKMPKVFGILVSGSGEYRRYAGFLVKKLQAGLEM